MPTFWLGLILKQFFAVQLNILPLYGQNTLGKQGNIPDMLLHLMQRVGADPRETLMIGDTTHDLELARNAGAAGVAVSYGAHSSAGLAELNPLALVHTVDELRRWLRANA
jgi:phosphoglycolate phosphatase-like HAD superfamily hydrolase